MLVERIKHITGPNFERAEGTPLIIKRKEGLIIAVRSGDDFPVYRVSAAIGRNKETLQPLGFCHVTVDHIEDARDGALFVWQIAGKQAARRK
ncbi:MULTISPECIES: hypothetical protein [Corallincola]|uniref:Uncharacterized protein n=3 Tax=Corallincola TaxID=1775176 RepID=A0A368NKF5_9GAMM|nr:MULTISPECIES: hypothetical protein [Corallincola]RCU51087.1 hypothetical protein DU002_07170 [Corallincola holothuriorum]TAA46018.1 hypothetical protein EXY25_11790 [Corallincola spongiicola]TCI04128.1 hypothetical protein EZV61_08055 [Corallincola luteus]